MLPIKQFTTHKKQVFKGLKLKNALNSVADKWEELAYDIRKSNDYALHVTEAQKDISLQKMLLTAKNIRLGIIQSFTILQRLDYELTGESFGFLEGIK